MSNKPLILITHYHLRRGGVTRVIEHQVEAIRMQGNYDVVVCVSQKPNNEFGCPIIEWPSFAYSDDIELESSDREYQRLMDSIEQECWRLPDLLHAHNHSLGKSGYYLDFINWWVKETDKPAIFQLHDFAEDGRSSNYKLNESICKSNDLDVYLHDRSIRYALLNRRDVGHLESAGIPKDEIVRLPNAVNFGNESDDDAQIGKRSGGYITYPTRAIRRKNLGELILFARCNPETEFHVTLSPQNPKEKVYYDEWVSFLDDENIHNVKLEAGDEIEGSFEDYLSNAASIITTSVAEGFGLAFLEPWLAGNALIGRDLDGITDDFKEEGVDLTSLYSNLSVHQNLFDKNTLLNRWKRKAQELIRDYDLDNDLIDTQIEAVVDSLSGREIFDFGWLDAEAQREVIQNIDESTELCAQIQKIVNSAENIEDETILQNQKRIKQKYNLKSYSNRLDSIYEELIGTKRLTHATVSTGQVLKQFLNLKELSMLRM